MNFLILSIFLAAPILSRMLMGWAKRKEESFWLEGWVFGIAQDVTIAFLLYSLLCLWNLLQWTSSVPLFFLLFLFIGEVQLYHFLDSLMLYMVNFRMKLTFFRYLLEFKDFKSSAIEYGIRPILVVLVAILFLFVFGMWLIRDDLMTATLPIVGVMMGGFSLLIGVSAFSEPWKHKMYLYHNCLFREGVDFILSIMARGKEHVEEDEEIRVFKAQCEDYRSISPHYLLLKMTNGFTGEKLFHIRVDKEERPHIIMIALESFGAKHLGCLGNPLGASPQFDRLAKEGILFSRFHAASIPTSRSLMSTLFGIYPDMEMFSLQERNPLFPLIGIPSIVKSRGYQSIYHKGASLAFFNARHYLKHHGFDEMTGDEEIEAFSSFSQRASWGIHDKQLFDYSLYRLKKQEKQGIPTFMMICTISNHHPWQPPKDFQAPIFDVPSQPLYARYLQTFYYCDAMLGRFIDDLRKEGIAEKSLIFITADNAQPMGEHDENFMPLKGVYEENHHIPLLILADGRIDRPRMVDELGSQIDLLPTMMDILDLKGINHSTGTSLMRKAPERHVFCVNPHILPYVSHQQDKYKYCVQLESDFRELYDLENDPQEKRNIIYTHSHIAEKLHVQLLQHFTSLQYLYMESRITPANHRSLVLIGEHDLTDDHLIAEAENLKELRSLIIAHCGEISDKGLVKLSEKVKQLDFLYLENLHITGETLKAFEGKTEILKELTLSHCLGITPEDMAQFLEGCPNLLEVTLTGSIQVEDNVIERLAKSCPKISNLELNECYSLTDKAFEAIASSLPSLDRLNLQSLMQITDETLEILSKGHFELHTLHLLESPGVTEKGILKIVESNQKLRRFSFSGTHVSNQGIKRIVSFCPDLMKLCIFDCTQITEEGFQAIIEKCQDLIILELAGCPHLTDDFFRRASEKHLDHILVAYAPKMTDEALKQIRKMKTIRTLFLTHCPKLSPELVWEIGKEMNQTGLLEELTFNQTKKIYHGIYTGF